jgi:HEAT repeat protein
LGQIDNIDVWPLLERAIADKNLWVRYYAVRSAARRGISASAETLNRLAQLDPAMQVRVAAVEALGQLADDSSVPLLAALAQSPDGDLARAAVTALGATRRLDALPPLSAALESPDAARRIDALRALGASGRAEAVADLHRIAKSDREAAVATAAVESLGRIVHPDSIGVLISLTAYPTLRAECVTALSRLAEGNEEFIGRGLSDPRADVRLAVVDALTRSRGAGASNLMKQALEDTVASVRFAALFALSLHDAGTDGKPRHGS